MTNNIKRPVRKSTGKVARDFLARVPSAYIFPLRAGAKKPPLFKNELELAFNDEPAIKVWTKNAPGCNWGVANKKSGLIVMDVDAKPGKIGRETLDNLELMHGPLPPTLTVRSPSGGLHYYFTETDSVRHAMRVSAFGQDVDSTNYVVLPGCVLDPGGDNGDGGTYTIIVDAPIAPAPDWFAEYLVKSEAAPVEQVPEIDLDQDANVQWAINYLSNDAPSCIQGKNGEFAMLLVYGALKDRGISLTTAIDLVEKCYNVPGKCDPLWNLGDGPLADRHDIKAKNAYGYLKETTPGASTAEAEFAADPLPPDTPDQDREQEKIRAENVVLQKERGYQLKDFLCYLPERDGLIFIPQGADEMWSSGGVDTACPWPKVIDPAKKDLSDAEIAKLDPPDRWLRNEKTGEIVCEKPSDVIRRNKNQRVAGMTWWPGKDAVIRNVLVHPKGGVTPKLGAHTFNRYRGPRLTIGKPLDPKPWLDHVKLIYPDDWEHIVHWLAWRVQHPDVKILHALVMGGATRIGKDTILKPVAYAIGPWNFQTTNAQTVMDEPKYNAYLEAVICIINEAKDFGDQDRFAFYDRMKPWLGGTATEVLMVADKYVRAHPVIDLVGFIITTNHKVRGLYLPDDDARHYCAWSNRTWQDWGYPDLKTLDAEYFGPLYDWYKAGGYDAVAHYLRTLPLDTAKWSPTAPPPKTEAWYEIVKAYADPNTGALTGILETLGDPPAVTVGEVGALDRDGELGWLDPKSRNSIPAQFEDAGYVRQRNPDTEGGRWMVGSKTSRREVAIYVAAKLGKDDRVKAAREVHKREQRRAADPPAKLPVMTPDGLLN